LIKSSVIEPIFDVRPSIFLIKSSVIEPIFDVRPSIFLIKSSVIEPIFDVRPSIFDDWALVQAKICDPSKIKRGRNIGIVFAKIKNGNFDYSKITF
jgi:hypothetical protein